VALGVTALLTAACSDAALTSSTTASTAPSTTAADGYTEFGCQNPPLEQRTSATSTWLALDPHPVTAGASVALEIGTRDGRAEDYTGSWVGWECWNGSGWVTTHIMELGWESGGRVVPGEPGVTWTVAGVAYRTPNEFWLTVPNVPPGWYRLRVDVFGSGSLAVEVVEAG
jgi:hypothetical protein